VKRAQDLVVLPPAPRGPFGEEPVAWYRRRAARTPFTKPASVLTATLALLVGGVHGTASFVAAALVIALPGFLLDRWWLARRRREGERLLPQTKSERSP
jgi:hypothetical protein